MTGDKDSLQLVTDATTVKLVSTRMGRTTTRDMTPEAFYEEYGFAPKHIVDLKALMGDSSDNYPGVKGVGEKTAMALIQLYHTVEHLYSHMPDLCSAPDIPAKPGLIKKLEEGREYLKKLETVSESLSFPCQLQNSGQQQGHKYLACRSRSVQQIGQHKKPGKRSVTVLKCISYIANCLLHFLPLSAPASRPFAISPGTDSPSPGASFPS